MTNPASPSRPDGGEPEGGAGKSDASLQKTPSTDMQSDGASMADSGADVGARGTAAESAMKQTSKTDNETGSVR